jgi:hypothetical protein
MIEGLRPISAQQKLSAAHIHVNVFSSTVRLYGNRSATPFSSTGRDVSHQSRVVDILLAWW